MIRTICLLVLLLVLVPMTSFAQKGWVRMPEGPWTRNATVYFLNDYVGFVLDSVYSQPPFQGWYVGSNVFVTYDGGHSWRSENDLVGSVGGCIRSQNLDIQVYTVVGWAPSKTNIVLLGGYQRLHCGDESFSGYSSPFMYDSTTGGFFGSPVAPGRFNTVDDYGNGVLTASCLECFPSVEPKIMGPAAMISVDSGIAWQPLDPPSKPGIVIGARFSSRDSGVVWTDYFVSGKGVGFYMHWTSDRGSTWRTDTLPSEPSVASLSAPFPDLLGVWYWQPDSILLSSSDLGRTWTKSTQPPKLRPVRPDDSFFDFHSGYRIVHLDASSAEIDFTSDSGVIWVKQTEVPARVSDMTAPSERVAYAVGPNGLLYKTTDGGGRFADVAEIEDHPTKLKAWSSGSVIMVESASDDVRVFDLLGRVVRTGREAKLDGFAPGVYFVVSGDESVRVMVGL